MPDPRNTAAEQAQKRLNKPPGFELVERARALAPLIAREANEIERTRRLTPPVVSALIENGLYRALMPRSQGGDRKSTRLNSSHRCISYAVFCLNKKKNKHPQSQ